MTTSCLVVSIGQTNKYALLLVLNLLLLNFKEPNFPLDYTGATPHYFKGVALGYLGGLENLMH